MYHEINATELFRERQLALLEEAEDRRLARQLRFREGPSKRSKLPATPPYLGFLAALVVVAIMLVVLSNPAYASTTFTVNTTGDQNDTDFPNGFFDGSSDGTCDVDSGLTGSQCTLRAAIEEANLTTATDTIGFNIPGSGVHTISVSSPLPDITQPLTINGYTQPGSSVNTSARGTNAKLLIEIKPSTTNLSRGLSILTSNTVVRGLVINGFNGIAIVIAPDLNPDPVVTNVRLEGNFIGTDPSGTIAQPNRFGVDLYAASNSTVGGTSLASRNLISGNTFSGVDIEGVGARGTGNAENNKVQGNLIGTQKDGVTPLGNGAQGVTVAELDNIPGSATGNSILSNTIFSNGGLGIDLALDGVNLDDVDDPSTPDPDPDSDTGPNNMQNFPEISSATSSRRATNIKGTLNSTPNTTFTLQLFSSPQRDDSGFGEGQMFKVQKSVTTNDAGDASFTFKLKRGKKIPVGQFVSATATDSQGNTSEFSGAVEVVSQ